VTTPRPRHIRRVLAVAPAAALLALAPAAAADPPAAGLSIDLPPLLSLSVPAQAGPLEPGLRLLIPQILDLTLPVDLGGSGFPVGGLHLNLPGIDLPPDIAVFAGGLLGIDGLGTGLAALVPSLSVAPDLDAGLGTGGLDLQCGLSATFTLPSDAQPDATGDVSLRGCTSTAGVALKSADGMLSAAGTLSSTSTSFSGAEHGTLMLTWDDQRMSTVDVQVDLEGDTSLQHAPVEGRAPIIARVTGGALQGDTVVVDESTFNPFATPATFSGTAKFTRLPGA